MSCLPEIVSQYVEQNFLRNRQRITIINKLYKKLFFMLCFRLGVHRPGCPRLIGQHGRHMEVGTHRRYDFTGIKK